MKTLICGAVESEIQFLKSKLVDSVLFLETGIGIVESAITLSRFLAEHKVDRIFFTGTAGAYKRDQFKINQSVVAKRTSLVTPLSLMMKGYAPDLMHTQHKLDINCCDDIEAVHVATVLEITSDREVADLICDSQDVDVEHMELFSIASTATAFHIDLTAVLGISNYVDVNSHQEWVKNHQSASKSAQEYIYSKFFQ